MRHPIAVALFGTVFLNIVTANATTIDFEAQGASAPSSFTGVLNSPLSIGIATFRGGQLLRNVSGAADTTAVYATTNFVSGAYLDPITIAFSQVVSNFSLLLTNQLPDAYTLVDNNGVTTTASITSFNTSQTITLTDSGITQISIWETAPGTIPLQAPPLWYFAIDNVSFTPSSTPVPEPAKLLPLAGLLLSAVLIRRKSATRYP